MANTLSPRRQSEAWLFLMPAFVLLVLFTHYPIFMSLVKSFFLPATKLRPARFAGFENYAMLMQDETFIQALVNNFKYALIVVPLSITLSLTMALLVNRRLPGRSFVRTAYFSPTVLPMIAAANMWLFFYTPQIGGLDKLLALFGVSSHNWLGDPSTALGCLMAVAIWKDAGFFMIFYLAALQSIPPELVDAGKVEGAGRFAFFRKVTFPLLMPTTVFVAFNAMINAFRLVDHIFIMTKGGPDNSSTLLLYYLWEVAFEYWETSYASTITVVILAILGGLTLMKFTLLERHTHYQ